ncbi:hypothetical protein C8B47_17490, partial [filamentous cyanobacterium CCP4]
EQVMAQHGWEPPASDNATTPEEITELVETVNRHPRALVLLAREVAKGVRATTRNVAQLMAKLEAENPGERENSLYASVELSLRRLPDEMRERVKRLAVVHGGGQIVVLATLMSVEVEEAKTIAIRLMEVGMAEEQEYGYLRLDSALPAYLQLGQPPEHLAQLTATWAEAMVQLVNFLYEKVLKDSTLAFKLTLLELPNLIALLDWLGQWLDADGDLAKQVAATAGKIEQLLASLNQPQALARSMALRERAAEVMPEWGETQFENERLQIHRLLDQRQLQEAYRQSQALLVKAKAAGSAAYRGADYDLALAYWLLGEVLIRSGQAASALELFVTAQKLFETLSDRGEVMLAGTLNEQAICLQTLGQLEAAAAISENAINLYEKLENFRGVALSKLNLATVLMLQERYEDSIIYFKEVLTLFEQQNDPQSVAKTYHQIGNSHQGAGQYEAAEMAYRKSLEIETRIGDWAGQAMILNQLGTLYHLKLNRPEEAVNFYRQAADIFMEQGDLRYEGVTRNNIGATLFELRCYEEARIEIQRAIDCEKLFGHATALWMTFSTLHKIETAIGHPTAARAAWQQARDAYLAYRQQGGYAQSGSGKLVEHVLGLLAQQQVDAVQSLFVELINNLKVPVPRKKLIQAMVAILNGSRDPALADDPALDYDDAAEVLFFIERLSSQVPDA